MLVSWSAAACSLFIQHLQHLTFFSGHAAKCGWNTQFSSDLSSLWNDFHTVPYIWLHCSVHIHYLYLKTNTELCFLINDLQIKFVIFLPADLHINTDCNRHSGRQQLQTGVRCSCFEFWVSKRKQNKLIIIMSHFRLQLNPIPVSVIMTDMRRHLVTEKKPAANFRSARLQFEVFLIKLCWFNRSVYTCCVLCRFSSYFD